jgi:excisionase family DNA binding protein
MDAGLTNGQAADLLDISEEALIQLLDEGKIACQRVGIERRVKAESVLRYKRHCDDTRRAVLNDLAEYDQEIGI